MPENEKVMLDALGNLTDDQIETFAHLLDTQAALIRQMKLLALNGRIVLAGQYTDSAEQIGRLWRSMLGMKDSG